ncbi:MAG: DNA replication/repair protein RecF [Acidimicrobiia bacterium]|nr:DNA replication/repair protein RecF [Acidimicrobiia bacterium]
MNITWLEARDFRSYETLRFEPDEAVNVLVGDNGQGKTSVIEAIGYLGTTKSLRGVADEALIREGTSSAVIRGAFDGRASETVIECEIPMEGRRKILVNGKRPTRMRDVLTTVSMVAFLPDDLDLVKRGSAIRRGYLDDLAARLWPQAAAVQTDYDRALRQRNALLKQEGRATDSLTLDVWDERLARAGAQVLQHRRAVATNLQPHLEEAYLVVGGSGKLRWSYRSTWGSDGVRDNDDLAEAFMAALATRRGKELEIRSTTVGPHRDEPELMLDGRNARSMASQGEQRTTALALRIGSYRLIEEVRDQTPILLLDDVFSELDPSRAARVLDLMPTGQVFVTTAREDEVPIRGRRWSVRDGKVLP